MDRNDHRSDDGRRVADLSPRSGNPAGPSRSVRRAPLDVRDAAAYLGTSERHIRRLVGERRVPFVKLGGSKIRFLPDDLDSWLASQRVEPLR